jgi:hypothetical protein
VKNFKSGDEFSKSYIVVNYIKSQKAKDLYFKLIKAHKIIK